MEEDHKYHAEIVAHYDTWMVRFYRDGGLIRSEEVSFRWRARWVARSGLKSLRTKPEIIR